ncbi:hypothetical protein DFP72DRAFT_1084752 [Ephemerocybe angulata]|uniref:Uncharacterized protein n=1 Tax=Ephemerocybe angulata TaxID=980116 RepID=A0A8H6H633_9AGAR|nr:hypothetical protein DFP72DRAFT_1084752 [Tulosesus angulatus]
MVGWRSAYPELRRAQLPALRARVEAQITLAMAGNHGEGRLLGYDSRSGDLRDHPWPLLADGSRSTPDNLDSHRLTHYYKGPCCFCAYVEASEYTEAKIGLLQEILSAGHPEYVGNYAAICATQTCGYFVLLEPFYAHPSTLVKAYLKRDTPIVSTDPFLFMTDDTPETMERCGLRQVQILSDGTNTLRGSKRLLKQMDPHYFNEFEESLDELVANGLKADKFWDLFVQCTKCNFVLPRHYFPYHHKCATRAISHLLNRERWEPPAKRSRTLRRQDSDSESEPELDVAAPHRQAHGPQAESEGSDSSGDDVDDTATPTQATPVAVRRSPTPGPASSDGLEELRLFGPYH